LSSKHGGDPGKARSASLPYCFHKKSLCVENAEANSERNLYNPPSGLVLSLHIPVKASFLIRLTPFFSFHLKCTIENYESQMTADTFPAFFCRPIKVGTGATEHIKSAGKMENVHPPLWKYGPPARWSSSALSYISSIVALLRRSSINSSMASDRLRSLSASTIWSLTCSRPDIVAGSRA
jgi:hypothetical protein